MKKMKRIDTLTHQLEANLAKFRCPHCKSPFTGVQNHSLHCTNGHTFNINKKGYIHLLTSTHKTLYDTTLFAARNFIYEANIYEAFLVDLMQQMQSLTQKSTVLDAGCGEGYFLNKIAQKLTEPTYIGIDIAKDGLIAATKSESPIIWTVGDLANLPLQDNSLDLILNILSPANYEEFQRTLKPEGNLLKVVPGQDYLKEIRTAIKGKPHSNELVIQQFSKHFKLIHTTSVTYPISITPELWTHLIRMTPMTASLSKEELHQLEQTPAPTITIDLVILVGMS